MDAPNAAMTDYWNAAGETWARFQEQLDRQLAPLGAEAMRRLPMKAGDRVLDIGCGCGGTTLALAAQVGPAGEALGVDVSEPMLQVARSRSAGAAGAAAARFLRADAQTADLPSPLFDGAFSRFGVMFFNDPSAAFANIRKAMKPSAPLAFVSWLPFLDNPWLCDPMAAAQDLLPPQAPPDPLAPGPFAFADPGRVRSILTAAGFRDVAIDRFDARIGGGTVEQTLDLTFRVGPLGAALRERPDLADSVAEAVRSVLIGHDTPAGVKMLAAVWIVTAKA